MPGEAPAWIVGIDLGTTHTVVAWADPASDAAPRLFPIPQLVTAGEVAARPLLASCLYAPHAGERVADPWGEAPWTVGELAERRGAEVPRRMVGSAKSWLGHKAADRTAAILPWGSPGEDEDLPRVSPVDASAMYLAHVKRTWNEAFAARPLELQDVVLTVPASFDESARELTVEAARRAGLEVRLLEEPQAAFYDFMQRAGAQGMNSLLAASESTAILVCDVGGGTTDLSLMRVFRDASGAAEVERVAVGKHLLLGGDNMDLALAHLAEERMAAAPERLAPDAFSQLVASSRRAKERLLSDDPPENVQVTVLGSGSRLIGGARSALLGRGDVTETVLEGFFPFVSAGVSAARARSALVAFGLPYERDVAITSHVAAFLARHGETRPTAVLYNGGVFRARPIAERVTKVLSKLGGAEISVLPHPDPDIAVARGAVVYGLARRGVGQRIQAGAARGYYMALDRATGDEARRAVCVIPRGATEGVPHVVRALSLVVGRPVRFDLVSSSDGPVHRPGEVIEIDDEHFEALPPLAVAFEDGQAAGEVRVALEGELSPVGTLDLACIELDATDRPPRRFQLVFQLRPTQGVSTERLPSAWPRRAASAGDLASRKGKRFDLAAEVIDRVFGKGRRDVASRDAKDLLRELEKILGERSSWTLELARALYDLVWQGHAARKRSADHERMFWLLAGYCIRPGFGDLRDRERISALAPLFLERVSFADNPRVWQQFWIAWRRTAGGLDEAWQTAARDATDALIAPSEKRLKKIKGWKSEAAAELIELVSSLERVAAGRRAELGNWLLERTWTDRDPRLRAALGRLGARVPSYGSAHYVVMPKVAEKWLEHLLREPWDEIPTASYAAVQLARMTGDRARDVSERVRQEVLRKLAAAGAKEEWVRAVRELVPVAEAERVQFFGEGLPVGLRLAASEE